MGYTHYYSSVRLTSELASAAAKIAAVTPVALRGWDGTGAPVITPDLISFNGDGATGDDCETFLLTPNPEHPYQGCKTNLRPYDTVVVAILVAAFAQEQTGIDSDGDWDDWQEGIALYEAAVAPLAPTVKDALFMQLSGIHPDTAVAPW